VRGQRRRRAGEHERSVDPRAPRRPEVRVDAVAHEDRALVGRAQGVGPKLAQRIVNELKDKAGSIALGPGATAIAPQGSQSQDAVSALANLGFRPAEAAAAVAKAEAELGPDASLDLLVRAALKKAAK